MKLDELLSIYLGSDGDVTKALYDRLRGHGVAGIIATNLFRAHKTSSRAKKYRGGAIRAWPTTGRIGRSTTYVMR